jgi:Protein of unknown function (DUF1552)
MNPAKGAMSRRAVLRGAGGAVVALPLLDAMWPARKASAAASSLFRKRFVVFFSGNGIIHENWRPVGTEHDFVFHRKGATDPHILSPLEAFKKKLIVLDGIDVPTRKMGPGANGHDKGMGHMLTGALLRVGPSGIGDFSHLPDGTAGGPSIDQAIAARLAGNARFSSLELGVVSALDTKRQLTSRMCYRGPFEVVPPENDPAEVFRYVFFGLAEDSQDAARLRRERRSVLDRVREDFKRIQGVLGPADRRKLEAHATAIREVENALEARADGATFAACKVPAVPTLDPMDEKNYPTLGKLQMDLLALSLACDLTPVASLQWSTGQSPVRFTWLNQTESHHGLSHKADDEAAARSQLSRIDHWYGQQFNYLLTRLDAIQEGDATLLDHCAVMWVNEQGNGDQHSELDVPYVLAGSCHGAFRTGRYLKVPRHAANDLYVSLMHAMGIEDVQTFGHAEVCKGPLPGLV